MNLSSPFTTRPRNGSALTSQQSGYDDQGRVYYRWSSSEANSHTQYIFGASFPKDLVPEDALQKPPSALASFFANDNLICVCFNVLIFGFFGLIIFGSIRGQKKRKLKYLPPKIAIEGHGIKRGLTAVEAAVLLEQPVDKVITMILFSTIKKGAALLSPRTRSSWKLQTRCLKNCIPMKNNSWPPSRAKKKIGARYCKI